MGRDINDRIRRGHGAGYISTTTRLRNFSYVMVACYQLCRPFSNVASLAVGHMGNSSVRWECAVFSEGGEGEEAAATGHFVHVFVDPKTKEKRGLSEEMREALLPLVVQEGGD